MAVDPAISFPGPFELLLLLFLLAVFGSIVLVMIRARGRRRDAAGFPVLPHRHNPGPGSFCVTGVDRETRTDRQLLIDADSPDNARAKAELQGMVVTDVTRAG